MKTKNKWLYLQIETKNRELYSRVLLAHEALQRNYNVVLGSKGRIMQLIRSTPQGAVLFKDHATELTLNNMKLAKSADHKILVLDEEMVVTHPDKIFSKVRVNPECLKLIDSIFFLGSHHKSLYDRLRITKNLNSWAITGNPRFDLLMPQVRPIYSDEAQNLKDRFGPFILINTNFAQGNHADGSRGFLYRLSKNGFMGDQQLRSYYSSVVNERKALFDEYCNNVIPAISKAFPNNQIIIRTHPEESDATYRFYTDQLTNVEVIHSGSVHPWMIAASAVIHSGCTTGIECFLLGKQPIFYDFLDKKSLMSKFSISVNSLDELIEKINYVISFPNKQPINLSRSEIRTYIANYKEKLSIHCIVDEIDKLNLETSAIPIAFDNFLLSSANYVYREFLRRIRPLKNKIFSQVNMRESSQKKFPGLKSNEVESIAIKIMNITQKNNKIKFTDLGGDAVMLSVIDNNEPFFKHN